MYFLAAKRMRKRHLPSTEKIIISSLAGERDDLGVLYALWCRDREICVELSRRREVIGGIVVIREGGRVQRRNMI